MKKKILQWGALYLSTSTRTTFMSVLHFSRKKRIMKRPCAIENRHKSLPGLFTILSEAAALCRAALDKSLSDTLLNIIFLPCSWPKFCAAAFLQFKRGKLTLTKTLRTFTNRKQQFVWTNCFDVKDPVVSSMSL